MRHLICVCDKCGSNSTLEEIEIKFRNPNMNCKLALCSTCFQEFIKITNEFMKFEKEYRNANDYKIARHLLGEK